MGETQESEGQTVGSRLLCKSILGNWEQEPDRVCLNVCIYLAPILGDKTLLFLSGICLFFELEMAFLSHSLYFPSLMFVISM
jgi:hypothetical protein